MVSSDAISSGAIDLIERASGAGARPLSGLDAARFEQLLAAAQLEQTQVTLTSRPEMGAPIAALRGAVAEFGDSSRNFMNATERGMERLMAIDPTDPRAMITALEVNLSLVVASTQLGFVINTTTSTKDSFKTLLMSQG
jgi:hypothetical protein